MLIGSWSNFDQLEEALTMHELIEIVKAIREREHRGHKMAAALKGIDLDDNKKEEQEDPVEAAKRRVALRESGLSEDEYDARESEKQLQMMGFSVIKE